jgi:hypothetical protein
VKHIDKDYLGSIFLEPTKLIRILNLIHERFGDHPNTVLRDRFDVFMPDNRHEVLTSVDDVLGLDNSTKRRINRLLLTSSASAEEGSQPAHEITIDFGIMRKIPQGTTSPLVSVDVGSEDYAWARRTLAEVEEQIERTSGAKPPVIAILVIIGLSLMLLVAQFIRSGIVIRQQTPDASNMWLTDTDIKRVDEMLKEHDPLTDEQIRAVVTEQLRNQVNTRKPSEPGRPRASRRLLYTGLLLLLILGGMLIVLMRGYPSPVFLWGDEVERYKKTERWRGWVWNVLIGGTILSLVATLLFEGLR